MALACVALGVPLAATAQDYPSKPIRLVIGFAAGGGTDVMSRLMATELGKELGQQIVPDNKPGADGVIASDIVAKAPPDGHTLLITSSSHAINTALERKLPYDINKDFAPVTQVASQQLILAVHPSLPVRNVRELIDYAKAQPDKLSYGTSSNSVQLSMELFKSMAGISATHVPYKGSGPMLTDFLGGQTQVTFAPSVAALPHVRAGKLRALAVGDSKRSSAMPDLPTVAESGIPGYQSTIWVGILAPANTPPAIVQRVSRAVAKIAHTPAMTARLQELGADPVGSTPDEFRAFVGAEVKKWAAIAKTAGVKGE